MNTDEPLGDSSDALDHQLRALLSVDPSPEFLVRVRGRIATDARAGFWHGWHGALRLAMPVALLAMLGIVMLNRETAVTPAPDRAHGVQRDGAGATAAPVRSAAPAPVQRSVVAHRPSRPRRAMAVHVEPPVVMPARKCKC